MKPIIKTVSLCVIIGYLVACAGDSDGLGDVDEIPDIPVVPEATPTPATGPISTPTPAPTSPPISTPTPAPTSPPISSPTPAPTSTPILTPTPSPTSPPISTPTPAPIPTPAPTSMPVPAVSINLALNKETLQSSTSFNGESSRAVDGNNEGSYRANSVTHTAPEVQPWWQVDLGSVEFVSHINIFNRTDNCCTERLSDFYVLVSETAFEANDLNQSIEQVDGASYYYGPTVDGSVSFDVGLRGRYIRVQLAGNENPLSLAEVEVMSSGDVVATPAPTPTSTPMPTSTPTPTPDPELVALYEFGVETWQAKCQSCHGEIAVTLKRERTRQQLLDALNIPAMRNITLSDEALDALTYALNNPDPSEVIDDGPGTELSGADIFALQCASCHSENATPFFPLYVKHTDQAGIENYTAANMPLVDPQSCIGDCATKVAEYLVSIAPDPDDNNGEGPETEPLRTERLKRHHYYKTLEYLLSPYELSTSSLSHPEDPVSKGFGNGSVVDSTLVFSYHTNAITLAKEFVEKVEVNPQIIGCDSITDDCFRNFYLEFAEKAYRRPLIQDQIERLDEVYGAGTEPLLGLGNFMGFVLQSPAMLYYLAPLDDDSDYTLANQLSYFLWNEPPDAELLVLADQNALRDESEFTAQIDRLLNSPKGQQTLSSFVNEWLSLDRIQAIVKDADTAPGFDNNLLNSLESDLLDFVNTSLSQDRSLEHLFGGSHELSSSVVTALSGYSDNVNVVRQGVLSHPGVLAFLAGPVERSPIIRGAYVLDKLLCDHRPPVDGIDDVIANIEIPEDASPRERTTLLTASPVCQTCHESINSLGFGFENYNGLGLPISESQFESFPLDTEPSTILSFNGVEGLQESLLGTNQLYDCTADNAAAYAASFVSLSLAQQETIHVSFRDSASLVELFKSIALAMLENDGAGK